MTLVPSSTMDVVLGNRLRGKRAFILVDVEGAEKQTIEGATVMLANDPKPIWLMEIAITEHPPGGVGINHHPTETFKRMFDAGYQAVTADKEMRLVTMADIESAQKDDASLLKTHNFLFR